MQIERLLAFALCGDSSILVFEFRVVSIELCQFVYIVELTRWIICQERRAVASVSSEVMLLCLEVISGRTWRLSDYFSLMSKSGFQVHHLSQFLEPISNLVRDC